MIYLTGCQKHDQTQPIPAIAGISPSADTIGAQVTIMGSNFSPTLDGNTVKFNGVTAVVTSATTTGLTVTVPNGATSGPVTVTSSGRAATSANVFTVADFPITNLIPSIVGIRYPLIIKGYSFDPDPRNNIVTINGVPCAVLAAADSQLTVLVPDTASSGKVAITSKGRKYVAANDLIVKKATVSTIAGFIFESPNGPVDGPLSLATFGYFSAAATDGNGNLYITEENEIRKITPAGMVSTLAGAWNDYGNSDGPVGVAKFGTLNGIALDKMGNIYVSDAGNETIRKLDINGMVTTIAGNSTVPPNWQDGTGSAAYFNGPQGLVVDADNYIYVADTYNNMIRKISPAGKVTTIAGNGLTGNVDGQGWNAILDQPNGIVLDQAGNLYVTEPKNSKIRKITPAGYVSTFAGNNVAGNADGQGTSASFTTPTAIAIDANGNLYVTDYDDSRLRMITPGGLVTTLAGNQFSNSIDGIGAHAYFSEPIGVAIDNKGVVYVLDHDSHKIRTVVIQ